jgi:hypothetical protein
MTKCDDVPGYYILNKQIYSLVPFWQNVIRSSRRNCLFEMHDQDEILPTLRDEYIALVDRTALVCGVIKYKPMRRILKESTVVLAPEVQALWKGSEPKARKSWMELKQKIDDMTPNDDDFHAAKYLARS